MVAILLELVAEVVCKLLVLLILELLIIEVCLVIALVDETYEVGIKVVEVGVVGGKTVGRTASHP